MIEEWSMINRSTRSVARKNPNWFPPHRELNGNTKYFYRPILTKVPENLNLFIQHYPRQLEFQIKLSAFTAGQGCCVVVLPEEPLFPIWLSPPSSINGFRQIAWGT